MFKRFRKWWAEVKDRRERRVRCIRCGRVDYRVRDEQGRMYHPPGWFDDVCTHCQMRQRVRQAAKETSRAMNDSFDPAVFLPALIPPAIL